VLFQPGISIAESPLKESPNQEGNMLLKKDIRIGSAALALILPIAVLLVTSGCSIEKPESPSWVTTWDIPIANKTYDIAELLEKIDDSSIITDSLGNPAFSITQSIDTIAVDDNLTVAGLTVDLQDSLGAIDIEPPSDVEASTNISDFLTINLGVVPPASFNYDQPLAALDRFSWVDVSAGTLDLTFYNGLEVDLDTFAVTIVDQSDMHVVGVATYTDGLDYLETETQSIDLSGQRISNDLSTTFDGHTPGGVLIYAGPQNLDATLSVPGSITVIAARAETPAINKNQTQMTALTDSTRVISSSISSGTLQFDISNYTQLPFTVDVLTSNFTNSGSPLQINRQIAAMSVTQVNVDLAGYDFSPTDSGLSQYVEVDMSASAAASAPQQYTVSASDSLEIHADLSSITFASITGQIKPTSVTIDPIQQDVEIPEGLDQAHLTQAELRLNLYNNSTVEADVDLLIQGGGNSISINDRISGKSSPGDPAELTILSVDSQEISDFLNPPPDQITISGQAILNPDYAISTITASDNFYGELEIYSPFAFAISDTISIDMDISDSEIDEDSRPDDFNETFRYGAIDVEFDNHLPLGLSLTLYIGIVPDSTLYDHPATLVLGPYALESGITDENGHVVESVISNMSESLDSDELSIFDNDTVYFAQMINLLPTDPAGVQVLGTDYVGIRSNATIEVKVGDNIWDDN
jgi:hypothetical protein